MATKFLSSDNVPFLWEKIKALVTANKVTKTSKLTNDSNFAVDASYVHTDSNYTAAEKTKLAGIDTGANKTTVDNSLSSTSTNPVQNKVINTALAGKVDTVTGKGLSTNDLTDELKASYDSTVTKVASLEATGGQANVIETVKVGGTALTPDASKAVDITVAEGSTNGTVKIGEKEAKVHGLGALAYLNKQTSLSAYGITDAYTKTQTDSAINTAIGKVTQIKFSVVTSLPETGVDGTFYLVAHAHGTNDVYDEYIYTNSAWEKIGNTDVDLTGYWATADLVAMTDTELGALLT